MNVNSESLQRWANNAAHAAGKALNQGKDYLYSARDYAYDTAVQAQKAQKRQRKQAASTLKELQDRWHDIVGEAGQRFSNAGSSFHNRFHTTERTLMKVGGLFLLFKCFSHRNQPMSEIAGEVRAHVEEKPIASAIIALGLGYALGKLLR